MGINDPLLELAMELEDLPYATSISLIKSCTQMLISILVLSESDEFSHIHVHCFVCSCADCWLDFAVERDD